MKKIVAITTCPTGIAHTYMAAEALKVEAQSQGISIFVEMQGALNTEDELTTTQIEEADVVLIAAGKGVSKSRFTGKKVYEVDVNRAIKEPKMVIKEALNTDDSYVYQQSQPKKSNPGVSGIYKHLMNGVSYMIPIVVAGGILLAISFIWGLTSADPTSSDYNVFAAALNTIGGGSGALGLMVPVLAAGIAYSVGDRSAIASGLIGGLLANQIGAGFLGGIVAGFLAGYVSLALIKYLKFPKTLESVKSIIAIPVLSVGIVGLVMILVIGTPITNLMNLLNSVLANMGTENKILLGVVTGAMMAFDMGGPMNKSIFAFSMIAFAEGNYAPFAAVMAGGVTPPLGLALATVLFKKKFTVEEREAGKSAWILGASNITEGAIPFAVADPFRVIPCIMAGSAVSSTLSLIFNAACRVPHGGLWATLIPNVFDNPVLWVVGIACGTVTTAILLNLVKKDVVEV